MAEETGGSGGAGGGSAGGTQVEGLQINFSAPGGEQVAQTTDKVAASVETFGRVTVRSRLNLEELIACGAKFTAQQIEELTAVNNSVQAVQNKTKADAEAIRVAQARTEANTAYLAKLDEMVRTYNNTTAELQRFKAEQLGVSQAAEVSIGAMERMAEATRKYGVVVKTVADIDEARIQWEKESAAQLAGQRAQAISDNLASDKEAAAQLKGQRAQAIADNAQAQKEASAELKGQRAQALADEIAERKDAAAQLAGQRAQALADEAAEKKEAAAQLKGQRAQALANQVALEKEAAAQLKGQRAQALADEAARLKEAAAQLKGQRAQALADNAKAEKEAAEKEIKDREAKLKRELDLDISYGEKSLKSKIDMLQKIAAYQADPRTAQTGVDLPKMFGPKAVGEVGTLDEKVKQYNETLGAHSKKLGDATKSASEWGKMLDNNRIRTEAIVLAHEALQGRFTRMPGSLMVMTEYMTAANIPLAGMVGTVAALAVGIIGLVYEMGKGQSQFKELANNLERTNNFAGTTAGSLDMLAHSVGGVHGNFKEAYEAIGALTASGKFTAQQIDMISKSVVDLNHVMGTDINATIREFETLAVRSTSNSARGTLEVAVAIEKLDQKYHFLNATQLETIINLEKQGKTAEASAVAIGLLASETERAAKDSEGNIGYLERMWTGVLGVIHQVGQGIADIGKKSLELRASKMSEAMTSMFPKDRNNPSLGFQDDESKLSAGEIKILHEYYDLQEKIAVQASKAPARDPRAQSEADNAMMQRRIQDRTLLKKADGELEDALQQNSEQLTKLLAANPDYLKDPKHQAYEDDRVEAIIKAHTQKAKAVKDDGRKYDLQAELQNADSTLKIQETANENAIKLLKDQYAHGSIAQEDFYARSTEARKAELRDLETNEQAKIAIIDKYKPKNNNDAARVRALRQQAENEYEEAVAKVNAKQAEADQRNSEAQADKYIDGINKRAAAEVKAIDQEIAKQQEKNDAVGKTKAQLDAYKEQQEINATAELQGQADSIQALLDKAEMYGKIDDGMEHSEVRARQIYEAEIARIRNLIAARETYSMVLKDGAFLEEQAAIQRAVDKQWEHDSKKIANDLTDAIVDGGGKGWKKLIHDMEAGFAKMILRPILQPMSDGIASLFNPTATQAGVSSAGEGGASGSIGYATAAANAYKAISGGFSNIGNGVKSAAGYMGQGVASMGNTFGSSAMTTFGQGMQGFGADGSLGGMSGAGAATTSAMSSAAMVAAGMYAGVKLGASISGEFGSRRNVNSGTAIGTGVGAVVGGPIGAAIGAAIGGIVGGVGNRLFGMGDKKVTATGMRGTISDASVTGTNYSDWSQKGGWFRSNKNGEDKTDLTQDVLNSFKSGLTAMESTVGSFAKTLGVGTEALKGYSKSFDILTEPLKEVKGTAAEQAQIQAENQKIQEANATKINEFFKTIGDDLSTRLIPDINKYALAGETASVTMERLNNVFTATNKIADMLGKSVEQMFGSAGLSSDSIRESLVNKSGGLSTFTSLVQNYTDKFLTDAEKLAPAQKAVSDAMASLGLSSVTTKVQFEDRVKALDLTNAKDQDTFVSLMQVADAFATVTDASDKLAASALEEKNSLQDEYDELTMTSIQLLAKQRDALKESNRALFDQINAIKQMKAAAEVLVGDVDNSYGVLSKVVSREESKLQTAKQAADNDFDAKIKVKQTSVDAAKSLADSVGSALNSMKPSGQDQQTQLFKTASAQLTNIINKLGTEALPSADTIKDLLANVQAGPNIKDYSTKEAYLHDFYGARNNLQRLGGNATNQESSDQKLLDALNDQKQAYDDGVDSQIKEMDLMLNNAQDQLDELKGQSTSLLTIADAMQAFQLMITRAMGNTDAAAPSSINGAYQQYLHRAPDADGLNYWENAVAGGTPVSSVVSDIATSSEATLNTLYQSMFGRSPDAQGLSFWMNAFGAKMDPNEIDQFKAAAQPEMNAIASGTEKDFLKAHGVASLAVGTNNVPKDGLAMLHEGEAVIPKADNRALRSAVAGNASTGTEVVAALREVKAEMAAFRIENKAGMIAMQRDTSITANKIKRIEQGGLIIRDTSDA